METTSTPHRTIGEYEQQCQANRNRISELQARIASLEASIASESERCAMTNKEKTSSLYYAQRIQRAAFPQKEIGGIFGDYFIFTKPIGIVTGDFYKALETKHYKIFALADCAGHGVPGAFLTMLGLSALKESIAKHYYDTDIDLAKILDGMRQFVKSSLRSGEDGIEAINDGLNLTLCAFSRENGDILFAGANQNVYLYSCGTLTAYNGDRMPIGWSFKGDSPFAELRIPAHRGDSLYLATDSLQNQFGGPNNAKFSTKRLTAMFEQIAPLPLDEQKAIVSDTVNRWVEGHVQVDDLTVACIKVD